MANRTSNDASRSFPIETTRVQRENSTDPKKQISGNKSLYIAKNCVALKFEKIKKSFSTLIHGKEFSKQAHSTKIINIKNKIKEAKIGLNTSEKKRLLTTNVHARATEDRSQLRKQNQARQSSSNNTDNPSSNKGSHRGIPAPLPQTTVLPAYVTASTLPTQSYFQNTWYQPMPSSAPSPQANMATTRPDPSAGRQLPNTRSMETSARPVRQNYRLGNAPDRDTFYHGLLKGVQKELSSLSQMTTLQKLHVLSHMMYSKNMPNYPDAKMRNAAFELINKIEQLRLDYVPNANDGSSNIYKVIFNNLIRNTVVGALPLPLLKKFNLANEEYKRPEDFGTLVKSYLDIIAAETDGPSETARTQRTQVRPGDVTSEWIAKMNQSISPFREQIENWNDLDKYQALQYLLRGSKGDLSSNERVKEWTDGIDDIRNSNVHDADDYSIRNEQKVFYNNNLRSILKHSLPEDFQEEFNKINQEFQGMDPSVQATVYEQYLQSLRAIVSSEMRKLSAA
jgi:hypothetical protein